MCSKDFANQVYWSKSYTEACRKANVKKGKVVSPEVGEYMSGQPRLCRLCFAASRITTRLDVPGAWRGGGSLEHLLLDEGRQGPEGA